MSKPTKRVVAVVVAVFALAVLVGMIEDGIDRWQLAHGQGTPGMFTVEGTEEVHYGKPPSTTRFTGTFVSDDGLVSREVHLAEGPPGGTEIGDQLGAVWDDEDPERVLLSDTRAFRNWVEGTVFLVVWLTVMGVVALLVRRHQHREAASREAPRHAA